FEGIVELEYVLDAVGQLEDEVAARLLLGTLQKAVELLEAHQHVQPIIDLAEDVGLDGLADAAQLRAQLALVTLVLGKRRKDFRKHRGAGAGRLRRNQNAAVEPSHGIQSNYG